MADGTSGIEKLRGLYVEWRDGPGDLQTMISETADQIEREHAEELAAMEPRLMPEGLTWPRWDDGSMITKHDAPEYITVVCLALDGSCYSLHYDMPDDERMCIYEVSERVKRPATEVLGADGLPIKVGDTVYFAAGSNVFEVQAVRDGAAQDGFGEWYDAGLLTHALPDTQERINEDTWKDATAYCQEYGVPVEYPKHAGKMKCEHLLGRQRELDAREMGDAE